MPVKIPRFYFPLEPRVPLSASCITYLCTIRANSRIKLGQFAVRINADALRYVFSSLSFEICLNKRPPPRRYLDRKKSSFTRGSAVAITAIIVTNYRLTDTLPRLTLKKGGGFHWIVPFCSRFVNFAVLLLPFFFFSSLFCEYCSIVGSRTLSGKGW